MADLLCHQDIVIFGAISRKFHPVAAAGLTTHFALVRQHRLIDTAQSPSNLGISAVRIVHDPVIDLCTIIKFLLTHLPKWSLWPPSTCQLSQILAAQCVFRFPRPWPVYLELRCSRNTERKVETVLGGLSNNFGADNVFRECPFQASQITRRKISFELCRVSYFPAWSLKVRFSRW